MERERGNGGGRGGEVLGRVGFRCLRWMKSMVGWVLKISALKVGAWAT